MHDVVMQRSSGSSFYEFSAKHSLKYGSTRCYMTETKNKGIDLEGLNSYAWILHFNAEKF